MTYVSENSYPPPQGVELRLLGRPFWRMKRKNKRQEVLGAEKEEDKGGWKKS
jgi:hypothetical protein